MLFMCCKHIASVLSFFRRSYSPSSRIALREGPLNLDQLPVANRPETTEIEEDVPMAKKHLLRSFSKVAGFALLAYVVALYVGHSTLLAPFLEDIASSDFFLDVSANDVDRSRVALSQCESTVVEELGSPDQAHFSPEDFKVWRLSPSRYLVRSHLYENVASDAQARTNFLCKLSFTGGDKFSPGNWEVEALEIHRSPDV